MLKLGYEAPRTGLHVAECLAEAGLPPGVLNVLTGSGSEAALSRPHPGVRALSFTGSVPVGRSVREEATARNCRVQLELGGHNPLLVMADAELDRAVEAAYAGAFWVVGQKCTATRRVYVEDEAYEGFRRRFLARVEAGIVGDPADPATEVGPLVNEGALEDVLAAVERGRAEGGTLLLAANASIRARTWSRRLCSRTSPTTRSSPAKRCSGLSSPSIASPTSTTGCAAQTRLSSGALRRDLHTQPPRGAAVHHQRRPCILHVNSQTAGADVHVPFGGIKGSGWGPHEQGRAAIEFYTDVVTVYQDAPAS